MAASFKFLDMDNTATQIASAGFPFPVLLGWVAAVFESALAVSAFERRNGPCRSQTPVLLFGKCRP